MKNVGPKCWVLVGFCTSNWRSMHIHATAGGFVAVRLPIWTFMYHIPHWCPQGTGGVATAPRISLNLKQLRHVPSSSSSSTKKMAGLFCQMRWNGELWQCEICTIAAPTDERSQLRWKERSCGTCWGPVTPAAVDHYTKHGAACW